MILSISCVFAVSDSNSTDVMSDTSGQAQSVDNNQVYDVISDNNITTSANNIKSESSTKSSKSSSQVESSDDLSNTSNNENSEIKSNNDNLSNEYGSEVLTTNSQSSDINIQSTSNQTQSNSSTKSIKTQSSNVKTEVILNVNSMSVAPYSNVTFKATGYTVDGKLLNNVLTAFKVNGITIGHTYFYNGIATLDYTIPNWSSANAYNLTVIVGETSTTLSQTASGKLTMNKEDIKVTMASYSASPKSTITLKVLATYHNGTAVSYAPVSFKVNGITVGSTALSNGVATLKYVTPSNYKTYTVLAIVGETSKIHSNSTTSSLVIKGPSKITLSDYTTAKKSKITITAKVTDNYGTVATGKVAIKINGITIKTLSLTNGKASVSYNTSALSKAVNTIYVVYGGSTYLDSSNTTSTLLVYNNKFSYSSVLKSAYQAKEFIEKNNRLPNYVTVSNVQVSTSDFLYMLAKVYDSNSTFVSAGFTNKTTSKTSKYNVKIYKSSYVSLAKDIVECYEVNGRTPYTIKSGSYTMSFADAFYFYTRAVAYIYSNGDYSSYGTILNVKTASNSSSSGTSSSSGSSSGTSSSSGSTSTTYKPTNVVPSGYSKYLVSSSNCQVNDTAIKKAVAKAVAGVTGTYNQAVAIFNYVNNVTDYSGYYNTRYGAKGTLSRGYGNCVDMAHLVIAMMRTANIPARYCHATCTFRSGLVTGHVWAEVYVNGKWYSCDATSSSNTFGNIVNWYSSTTVKRYISLSF